MDGVPQRQSAPTCESEWFQDFGSPTPGGPDATVTVSGRQDSASYPKLRVARRAQLAGALATRV
jgi:hypothetical protein